MLRSSKRRDGVLGCARSSIARFVDPTRIPSFKAAKPAYLVSDSPAVTCNLFGPRLAVAISAKLGAFRPPLNKLRLNRTGTAAVEFALVAAPFLAILLGTLELAIIFTVNTGLSIAADGLATQIRTGQVQAPGLAATASSGVQLDLYDTKAQLCSQIPIVSFETCLQQLQIDVRPLTSFQQTSSVSPINGSSFNASNLCFYSGNAGDVVEMRLYYLYPLIDPLLKYAFAAITSYTSIPNGSGASTASGPFFPVQTSQVFKSENYTGQTNSGAGC